MAKGIFITFEGGDGAGKSTQIAMLADRMRRAGLEVVTTREPGGSPGAEAIRKVILSGAAEPFGPMMEALLFAAARADHVDQLIRPAIEEGAIVLCDRFMDSSRVYQGVTGGIDSGFMQSLERVTVGDMVPDLTFILDIDPALGLKRAAARSGGGIPDRFEKENLDIQLQRRKGFLEIARRERARCVVIDADRPPEEIAAEIERVVSRKFGLRMTPSRARRGA